MLYKKCCHCQESLLLDLFHNQKGGKYNKSSLCKQCTSRKNSKRDKEKIRKISIEYRLDNLEKVTLKEKARRKTPKNKKIKSIKQSIEGYLTSHIDKYRDLIGCTNFELKLYLESLFTDAMGWDNYGVVWDIDHILPAALFDLLDPIEAKYFSHYKNMRPLLKKNNGYKSDHLPNGKSVRSIKAREPDLLPLIKRQYLEELGIVENL